MLSKKSQTLIWLSLLAIGLLTMIILIYFQVGVRESSEFSAWVTQCKTSVESNARFRLFSWSFSEDIRCPIQDITIKENLDDKKGQNAAKKEISKYINTCGDIYRKGNLDLFTDENTYCAICAISGFEDKGKEIKDLIGEDIIFLHSISSDKVYGTIFIYAKGEQEIKEFRDNFEREKNLGRIAAYTGPYIFPEWNAAVLFAEYGKEDLDKIGCNATPVRG
ncbi:hypothetical protein KY342_03575 [Candidatus Woesearchaeota archaeon]|nr:hypothetical protein [Candidatus Woesearchaeota archaeon]